MQADTLSIKRVFIDLLSIKEQVKDYFIHDPAYSTLVKFMCAKDYYNDENIEIPSLTQVSNETGLASYKIRKQLTEIHEALFNYETKYPLKFPKVEYVFYLKSYKVNATFTTHFLHQLPRIGENIIIPFLKGKLNNEYFFVENINHYFEGTTQRVEIYIKDGTYNLYWNLKKHEALETGEISFTDTYEKYEFQLKEMVGIRKYCKSSAKSGHLVYC